MVAVLNFSTPFQLPVVLPLLNMFNLIRLWLLTLYFFACHAVSYRFPCIGQKAQGGSKQGKGILSQIQVKLFHQTVADSTADSVSQPLLYQKTFAVMETFLLLLLCTAVFLDFMQRNMRGKIIVSITAFRSNDLDSALEYMSNYEEFSTDHISRADVCFAHRPTSVVSL